MIFKVLAHPGYHMYHISSCMVVFSIDSGISLAMRTFNILPVIAVIRCFIQIFDLKNTFCPIVHVRGMIHKSLIAGKIAEQSLNPTIYHMTWYI